MRKQFIFMFMASMVGGAIATVVMQQKNPFAVWAASGTRAIVLSRDAVCPPGFSNITAAENGRYLLADNSVVGTVSQGGGTPPGATPGGHQLLEAEMPQHAHNYTDPYISSAPQRPGGGGLGIKEYPDGNAGTTTSKGGNQAHNHPYSGFRLCEWTVN